MQVARKEKRILIFNWFWTDTEPIRRFWILEAHTEPMASLKIVA